MKKLLLLTAIFVLSLQAVLHAQTINTFPYNEGFESCNIGDTNPAGWTQQHIAATMSWFVTEGDAHSGNRKISIPFAIGHKTRLISPKIDLSGVEDPILKFWHKQPAYGDNMDSLKVYYKTSEGGTWNLLWEFKGNIVDWMERVMELPNPSVNYYIAFEAWLWNANGISLDDISIAPAPVVPIIYGDNPFALGIVYNNLPWSHKAKYSIENRGKATLTVNEAVSSNSELTVTGLPLTINSLETKTIDVSLDAPSLPNGFYNGEFVLVSNDSETPKDTIKVTATVASAIVTPYIKENFDDAIPAGWSSVRMIRLDQGGVDNSPCASAFLHDNQPQCGLQSCYIAMGTEPTMSFKYKILKSSDFSPAPANSVEYAVFITKDNGATWANLLSVESGGHVPSPDYKTINVDVSAYANELCLVQIVFEPTPHQDISAYLDDIIIGTHPEKDLAAVSIQGNPVPIINTAQNYTVSVKNLGSATQTSYTVNLMKKGETAPVASKVGVSIAPDETKNFEFPFTFNMEGTSSFYGEVVLNGDLFMPNNKTSEYRITVQPATVKSFAVGTDTVEKYKYPYNLAYRQSLSQTLYFPNELKTNSGEIRSLIYTADIYHTGVNLQNVGITVWIGETDKQDLTDGWIEPSALKQVYDGVLSFPAGKYQVAVPLDSAYKYTGKNLVVYSHRKDSDYGGWDDNFSGTAYPKSNRSIQYATLYSMQIDPANPPSFSENISGIPNTAFLINTEGLGALSGVVKDAAGFIKDAKIQIIGEALSVNSGSNGEYEFPYLKPGTYNVEVSKFGYFTKTVPVTVSANDTTFEDIELTHIPKYTVSGKVTGSNAPEGLSDVKITLSGYANYTATTDAQGNYSIPGIYSTKTYSIQARLTGYEPYDSVASVINGDTSHNLMLWDRTLSANNIAAVQGNGKVDVSWTAPLGYRADNYYYADGSYESGFRSASPDIDVWYGSKFDMEEVGEITSIDILALKPIDGSEVSESMLTVEIFDENRQLTGSSEPFYLGGFDGESGWVNVPINNLPYSGVFYAMVKWAAGTGNTNFIGFDLNGFNIDAGTDWYCNSEIGWRTLKQQTNGLYGVFMIKANVNVEAGAKPQSKLQGQKAAPKPTPLGYKVYRLERGQAEGAWTELGETTDTFYTDNTWSALPQGGYQYAVKGKYTGDRLSNAIISGILGKDIEFPFTVNLSSNSGDDLSGAVISLSNQDDTIWSYTHTATGAAVNFPDIWKGTYSISVIKKGFEPYSASNVVIDRSGLSHNAELIEIILDPFGLRVKPNVENNTAIFTWNKPSDNFFDDIESYEDFIIENIGSYTLYDGDSGATYAIENNGQGTDYYYPNQGYKGSYIVFNPSASVPPIEIPGAQAYEGDKYLACFSSLGQGDNWLILPKLCVIEGSLLNFWAKSLNSTYGLERMRIAVSTTGTNPADFTVISDGDYVEVPDGWMEYTYDLSAYHGKDIHVAIVCVSENTFALMLDNIFLGIPDGKVSGVGSGSKSLDNFTVYFEGKEVASGVADARYEFGNLVKDSSYTAGVQAVYSSGVSAVSTINFKMVKTGIVIESKENFRVYPNPVTNVLNIQTTAVIDEIAVIDLSGRVMKVQKGNTKTVNMGALSSGYYVVRIRTANGVSAVKVVKQ
ncbi:MAG: choice-of-anchor J domain-containing protein [Bacteroidales bacterium]|jgi:hypothetical protein|nr:choice-of-anchor J domain-containing protein [Bacteroidales bacterium]